MNQRLYLNRCQVPSPLTSRHHAVRLASQMIGRCALQSLHQELAAYPKPGLVSPVDSGSHKDMDSALFFRSLFSLRKYFCDIALVSMHNISFPLLKQIGVIAEERMLRATGGVNTHRGAIFNLGLLAAAAGHLRDAGLPLQGYALSDVVIGCWGDAITEHGRPMGRTSHGGQVASRYGVGGALDEAASGFPHVFKVGLPALQKSLAGGADPNSAAIQCLFNLMEVLPDTNILYRGGEQGLAFARDLARSFLSEGGVQRPGWQKHAIEIHRQFIDLNLSPGGSADLLAATLFVDRLQRWDMTLQDSLH